MSLNRHRWAGLLAVAAVAGGLLAGCSSAARPEAPDKAEAYVRVNPDGSMRIDLRMPQRLSVADLARVGARVAEAMFGKTEGVRARVTYPKFGYPNATVDVPHAYRPGTHPTLSIDAAALDAALGAEGIRQASLSVCGPRVPVTIEGVPRAGAEDGAHCRYWAEISRLQRVAVGMRPDQGSWPAQIILIGTTLLLDALALTLVLRGRRPSRRRRGIAAGLAVTGIAAGLLGLVTGAAGTGDNLGVHGDLSGGTLRAATALPWVVLPLLAVSVAAGLVTVLVRRRGTAPATPVAG